MMNCQKNIIISGIKSLIVLKKKNLIVKNEKYSLYNVVYNENYLRTEIKSYEGKIKAIFYIDRM